MQSTRTVVLLDRAPLKDPNPRESTAILLAELWISGQQERLSVSRRQSVALCGVPYCLIVFSPAPMQLTGRRGVPAALDRVSIWTGACEGAEGSGG